jgi:PAS domain S-box-containing protein
MRGDSLRTQILTRTFVPTAIIMLAVALVAFYAYASTLSDLVMERNQEVARLSAGRLSSQIDEYARELEAAARLVGASDAGIAGASGILASQANRLALFDAGLVVLDNHGKVAYTLPERLYDVGRDWSGRPYFASIVRTGSPAASDLEDNGPTGSPVVTIAVPVLSNEGQLLGVLAGNFALGSSAARNASPFYGSIVKLRLGSDGETYLVDGRGRVIYHPDPELLGRDLSARPDVAQALRGETGALRGKTADGREVLTAFAPVPGTKWGLVSESDWQQLLAPSRNYRRFLSLLLALSILLPALVVAVGVRRITQPVESLTRAANAVASGKFGQTITAATSRELQSLVFQFNRMSAQLSDSYAALQRKNDQLELVMRGSNEGIWDWDVRSNTVYFSPRWKSMLGYSESEIQDGFDAWIGLMHPADVARVQEVLREYLSGASPTYQVEHRLRHKDGSYRWILARGLALRDESGKPYRVVGSHSDITERVEAQEAVIRANQNLERRVAQRTQYLSALNAVGTAVSRSLDLEEITRDALEQSLEVLGIESGAAYRLEAECNCFVLMAHRGLSPGFIGAVDRLPVEVAMAGREFAADQPIVWKIGEYQPGPLKDALVAEGLKVIVAVPLMAKEKLVGALALSTRNERSVATEELALLTAIGRQVGVAIDNARLYEAEQARRDEAERRRQVAEGLRETMGVLNSRQSLQEMLEFIAQQACRVLRSDAAAIMHLNDAEDVLRIQASCGLEPAFVQQLRVPFGRAGSGRAVRDAEPVAVTDTSAMWRQMERDGQLSDDLRTEVIRRVAETFHSLLSVPLVVQGRPYGAISLYFREMHDFSEEEISLAESLGVQAALAIESASLREQAGQAAAVAERNRLARELHDSVTQNLYSMTLYAEATARLLQSGNTTQAAEHLRDMRDTSQEALREMRLLIFELRPPELEKTGLAGALQTRLQSVEARGGMQAELRLEGADQEPAVPMALQQELFQIAQEALNNSLKHSRAGRVTVNLHYRPHDVRLEIADDGAGFSPDTADVGGLGMRTMRERADRIGATLAVESQPGSGVRVVVAAPTSARPVARSGDTVVQEAL